MRRERRLPRSMFASLSKVGPLTMDSLSRWLQLRFSQRPSAENKTRSKETTSVDVAAAGASDGVRSSAAVVGDPPTLPVPL